MKNMFEVPDSYRNLVNSFGKTDAFIAIVLFGLYCIDMALSGILVNYVSADQITYIGGLTNLVFVGIVILILKIRKQGIETIGLQKGNIKLSLIMGITLAAILFFCNCLSHILFEKRSFIPIKEIMIYVRTILY